MESVLDQIKLIFLEKKEAIKGREIIDVYLKNKDAEGLKTLLRDHRKKRITGEEIFMRDAVDCFLDYFNVLSLAHITGVMDIHKENQEKNFILQYLDNDVIKDYYTKFYPLLLPQILYTEIMGTTKINAIETLPEQSIFSYFSFFLILSQYIDDEDVGLFLWFLDDGWTGYYNISHLETLLKNPDKIVEKLQNGGSLSEPLRGYFKFTDFITKYGELLKSMESQPLTQSAYWSAYGYWFSEFGTKLTKQVEKTYHSLKDQINTSGNESDIEEWRFDRGITGGYVYNKTKRNFETVFKNQAAEDGLYLYLQKNYPEVEWKRP